MTSLDTQEVEDEMSSRINRAYIRKSNHPDSNLLRRLKDLSQDEKDRLRMIMRQYEEAVFSTPHQPSDEEQLRAEITSLRSQVENLAKEMDTLTKTLEFMEHTRDTEFDAAIDKAMEGK